MHVGSKAAIFLHFTKPAVFSICNYLFLFFPSSHSELDKEAKALLALLSTISKPVVGVLLFFFFLYLINTAQYA